MALFGIADLHLSLGTQKSMDVFRGWENYVARLEQNWRKMVKPEDVVVVAGDISWAMKLEETRQDFAFLNSLPGTKLLVKGNHDYWWGTRKKMEEYFSACGFDTLHILFNNAVRVGAFSVCGTRGWFFDGGEDRTVLLREAGRLQTSIQEAKKLGGEPVAFLHYPPVCGGAVCGEIFQILVEQQVTRCYYGHLHGPAIRRAVTGNYRGVHMHLISCDSTGFMPVLIG